MLASKEGGCRTDVASEDWLFLSNHVSIQDSGVVGPHSPQFPLGGERTQQSVFFHNYKL